MQCVLFVCDVCVYQFSDMLIYASRTATRSLQFRVHGRLSVAGMAVSMVFDVFNLLP